MSHVRTIRTIVESVMTLVKTSSGCDDGIELRLQHNFDNDVEKFGVNAEALLRGLPREAGPETCRT